MALRTGICKGVASETASFVHHRQLGVTTRFKLGKRKMTARSLIVAPGAEIGDVAHLARGPIQRRIFSVHIVLPSRGVVHGHHDLVAIGALLLTYGRRLDARVTYKTGSAGLGSFLGVTKAETLGVGCGFYNRGMEPRQRTERRISVTNLTIRHAIVRGDCL